MRTIHSCLSIDFTKFVAQRNAVPNFPFTFSSFFQVFFECLLFCSWTSSKSQQPSCLPFSFTNIFSDRLEEKKNQRKTNFGFLYFESGANDDDEDANATEDPSFVFDANEKIPS